MGGAFDAGLPEIGGGANEPVDGRLSDPGVDWVEGGPGRRGGPPVVEMLPALADLL